MEIRCGKCATEVESSEADEAIDAFAGHPCSDERMDSGIRGLIALLIVAATAIAITYMLVAV